MVLRSFHSFYFLSQTRKYKDQSDRRRKVNTAGPRYIQFEGCVPYRLMLNKESQEFAPRLSQGDFNVGNTKIPCIFVFGHDSDISILKAIGSKSKKSYMVAYLLNSGWHQICGQRELKLIITLEF